MTRTQWFSPEIEPKVPGVYLTRSMYSGNEHLAWWRAFDGTHWHAGIMAVNTNGIVKATAPSYESLIDNPIIERHMSHLGIRWCGQTEREFA